MSVLICHTNNKHFTTIIALMIITCVQITDITFEVENDSAFVCNRNLIEILKFTHIKFIFSYQL